MCWPRWPSCSSSPDHIWSVLSNAYLKLCHAEGDCGSTSNPVLNKDGTIESGFSDVLLLAPALIGIFWGAPLIARELETGTYRLVWT